MTLHVDRTYNPNRKDIELAAYTITTRRAGTWLLQFFHNLLTVLTMGGNLCATEIRCFLFLPKPQNMTLSALSAFSAFLPPRRPLSSIHAQEPCLLSQWEVIITVKSLLPWDQYNCDVNISHQWGWNLNITAWSIMNHIASREMLLTTSIYTNSVKKTEEVSTVISFAL